MSTTKRVVVGVWDLFFGLLALGALATENIVRIVRGTYESGDLWNYFTYQSNFIAMIAMLTSSYAIWKGKNWLATDVLRGAATLYMVITGVVFALLVHNASPAVAIDNNIMHQVIPAAMFIGWIIHQPATRISFARSLKWLIYPLAYAVYASVYGAVTGKYFYSFLDPATNGGIEGVLLIIAALVAFGVVVAAVLVSGVPWALAKLQRQPQPA